MKRHYFECECSSDDHRLVVTADKEEKELSFHYFLSNSVWYKRLWPALKYLLGYKCLYGHFGETILRKEKIKELKILCDSILQETNDETLRS